MFISFNIPEAREPSVTSESLECFHGVNTRKKKQGLWETPHEVARVRAKAKTPGLL